MPIVFSGIPGISAGLPDFHLTRGKSAVELSRKSKGESNAGSCNKNNGYAAPVPDVPVVRLVWNRAGFNGETGRTVSDGSSGCREDLTMVTITRKMGNRLIHPGIRLEEIEAAMPFYPAGVYGIENADGVEIAEARVRGGKCRLYVQGRPAMILHDATGVRLITDVPVPPAVSLVA